MSIFDNLDKYMARECSGCFVHDKTNICLINIPKNASTYLRLKYNLKNVPFNKELHKNYIKIIIIRNPADRLWSSYAEILKCRKDSPYKKILDRPFYVNRHNRILSMKQFLQYIQGNLYDVHLFPQEEFLSRKGLKLEDIDWVYDFDNISQLDSRLSKIIQAKNIPKSNVKKFAPPFTIDKEIVEKIYPQDTQLYEKVQHLIHPSS